MATIHSCGFSAHAKGLVEPRYDLRVVNFKQMNATVRSVVGDFQIKSLEPVEVVQDRQSVIANDDESQRVGKRQCEGLSEPIQAAKVVAEFHYELQHVQDHVASVWPSKNDAVSRISY